MKFSPMKAYVGSMDDLQRKDWVYEPKLDGYRALCYVDSNVAFISRYGNDLTQDYDLSAVKKSVRAKTCILDGEIIAYDKQGLPNFSLLQQGYPATYIVFDILMKDGKSLINLPL